MGLRTYDNTILRLMKFSPIERRGDRWRFGSKTIGDGVIARLVASGRAANDGQRVQLTAPAPIGAASGARP
jgi:hypothetical protein